MQKRTSTRYRQTTSIVFCKRNQLPINMIPNGFEIIWTENNTFDLMVRCIDHRI